MAGGAGRGSSLLIRSFSRDGAVALLRIWLGAMMVVHGYPKMFGDNTKFFARVEEMGFPAPELFGWLAAFSEFGGGVLLILGLMTRPAALLVTVTMGVAALIRHFDDPFDRKELPLTYMVIAIAVLFAGPGKISLDRRLFGSR